MFLSPLAFGLLLALAMLVGWRRFPRALRWIAAIATCLLIVSMCPFGANLLVRQIEARVPVADICAQRAPATIVVLAAGFEREPADAGDFSSLESDSIRRALAGIELWRRSPGATLVFAGGGPFGTSESAALQRMAELLGVPADSIRREDRSQTTWENARQLRLLSPALPERIWLVSSAIHLPRALIAFRAAGFDPCAYASDRRYLPPGGLGYYLPQSSALIKTEAAMHELVGEVLYRWRAREASR
jgi:uncharacterized SAM-binding protein YcdF (DUF218 family)